MINIKKWRNENGVTQNLLAVTCGVSINTLRNWEAGVVAPNKENLIKLEKAIKKLTRG